MRGKYTHMTLAGGVAQRLFTADRLVDAHRRGERPRDQRERGDGLAAERQALWGNRVVRAAVGKPFLRGRGLEDRHLFLEDGTVVSGGRGCFCVRRGGGHERWSPLCGSSRA